MTPSFLVSFCSHGVDKSVTIKIFNEGRCHQSNIRKPYFITLFSWCHGDTDGDIYGDKVIHFLVLTSVTMVI